jgi:hypothetical protein
MRKVLQHIHRQPKAVRNQYAFAFASTFVGAVALIWVISLPSKLAPLADAVKEEGSGSFSTLFDQVGDQIATVKQTINEAKDELQATTTTGGIILNEEEVAEANLALEENASSSDDFMMEENIDTEPLPLVVMIGTTSATGTIKQASGTE